MIFLPGRLANGPAPAAILMGITLQLGSPSVAPRLADGQIMIEALDVGFVNGRALDRLRDGGSVRYTFRLAVSGASAGPALAGVEEQFVVSYDLWEERFAVTRLGTPSRSVSNLTSAEAEAWCLNNLALPIAALGARTPLWLRLEYRAEIEETAPDEDPGSGFGLGGLINIFSRREERGVPEGVLEAGPFRLSDLR